MRKKAEKLGRSYHHGKAMRLALALSILTHVSPAIGSISADIPLEIGDLVTAQVRKARRNFRALMSGETKAEFNLEGLFDGRDYFEQGEKESRQKRIEDIVIHRPDIAKKLVEEDKLDLDEKHFDFDLGRFYIETEYKRGVAEEESKENMALMDEVIRSIKKEIDSYEKKNEEEEREYGANDDPGALSFEQEFGILDRAVRKYGKDQTWAANFVGDLLRNKYGNCKARTKLNLAIATSPDIYWRHIGQVKTQLMGLHIRPIIQMGGEWFMMDGALRKLPTTDVTGMALMGPRMDVKTWIKVAPDVKINDENKDMNTALDLRILITGALLAGADAYLNTEVKQRLRSVYDLNWREEEEAFDGTTIDFTIDEGDIAVPLIRNDAAEEEPEEPEFELPKKERFSARISGEVRLNGTNIRDFSQLSDLEVTKVIAPHSKATSLAGLENTPLEYIDIAETQVSEISLLADKPLKVAKFMKTPIRDLSPLIGTPIEILDLSGWDIDDSVLGVLRQLKLKKLNLTGANIPDLSDLEGLDTEAIVLRKIKTQHSGYTVLGRIKSLRVAQIDISFGPEVAQEIDEKYRDSDTSYAYAAAAKKITEEIIGDGKFAIKGGFYNCDESKMHSCCSAYFPKYQFMGEFDVKSMRRCNEIFEK